MSTDPGGDVEAVARQLPDPSTLSDTYGHDQPDVLTWLQAWYSVHCDGDWEHEFGVKIDTLDNPGWAVQINLTGTRLQDSPYERFEVHRSEHDWFVAWIENGEWNLACGPLNLAEGLHQFRVWASDIGAR